MSTGVSSLLKHTQCFQASHCRRQPGFLISRFYFVASGYFIIYYGGLRGIRWVGIENGTMSEADSEHIILAIFPCWLSGLFKAILNFLPWATKETPFCNGVPQRIMDLDCQTLHFTQPRYKPYSGYDGDDGKWQTLTNKHIYHGKPGFPKRKQR